MSIKRFRPGKKKCVECGTLFEKSISTPFRNWCSDDCALAIVKKKNERKRKAQQRQEKKQWTEQKKVLKESIKNLQQYRDEARKAFQLFCRLRDYGLPCISCGKHVDEYQGGHYFDAGKFTSITLDEDNCHAQCVQCNKHLHGNKIPYGVNLKIKIGEDRFNALVERSKQDRIGKIGFDKFYYIQKKEEYEQKIKQLKQKIFANI